MFARLPQIGHSLLLIAGVIDLQAAVILLIAFLVFFARMLVEKWAVGFWQCIDRVVKSLVVDDAGIPHFGVLPRGQFADFFVPNCGDQDIRVAHCGWVGLGLVTKQIS